MIASTSEQFRLAGKEWVELDAAASLLEETKSGYLAQMMARLGDMPVSHAERQVKSSEEWGDYICKMVEARKRANMAKLKMDWLRMRFAEQQSQEATARAEMKL